MTEPIDTSTASIQWRVVYDDGGFNTFNTDPLHDGVRALAAYADECATGHRPLLQCRIGDGDWMPRNDGTAPGRVDTGPAAVPGGADTRQDTARPAVQVAGAQTPVVGCSRCGDVPVVNPRPREDLVTCERCAVNTVLRLVADDIERELICCDVYERLTAKGHQNWSAEDKQEKRHHAICYWSSASRALVLNNQIPPST